MPIGLNMKNQKLEQFREISFMGKAQVRFNKDNIKELSEVPEDVELNCKSYIVYGDNKMVCQI